MRASSLRGCAALLDGVNLCVRTFLRGKHEIYICPTLFRSYLLMTSFEIK